MTKIAEFESAIEFVAVINEHKDCLMSQDSTQDDPSCLWFNIDIPKGHGLKYNSFFCSVGGPSFTAGSPDFRDRGTIKRN